MAGSRRKKQTKLRCPLCRKPVELASPLSPFCSERCKLLDLGNWASGRYVIQTPLPDIEESADRRPGGATEHAAKGKEEG